MMSDDKVGGWVKKGQNHDDVILECPLVELNNVGYTYIGYHFCHIDFFFRSLIYL